MASAGSIFVDLLLKDANYVQGLNRARGSTRQFSGQVTGEMSKTGKAFSGVLSPVNNLSAAVASLGGVVAGALSAQKIIQYADTYRQLEGRLGLVAGEFGNVARTQEQLLDIAERTRQPLQGVTDFYSRLAQFIPEAERAQYDLLGVTESVGSALAITGETGASATAAMIQFTQAIGTNFEAAGQELRSLQEQAPRLTQALMKSFGDGTKSLQQLKDEGVLTRESVLRALEGTSVEGQKLAEELSRLPITVRQAFTQLDNAFLTFIGNSSLVDEGTSSLAASISFLANNLDIAAQAVVVISGILVARMAPALSANAIAFASSTQQAIAYQLALARMAGQASAASLAMAGLSRGIGLTLALVGGPFGAAFLAAGAAVYYLSTRTSELEKVQKESQGTMSALDGFYAKLTTASTARAAEIRKEMVALYDLQVAELETNKARLATIQTNRAGRLGKAADYVTPQEKALSERIDAQRKALEDLQDSVLSRATRAAGPSVITPPKIDKEAQKEAAKQAKELASIYDRNRSIITGLDNSTIKYSDTMQELNQLLSGGLITQDEYSEALIRAQDEYDNLSDKTSVWAIDTEAAAKRAAENIQDSLADFLFDPFEKGLDGMLDSFVKTLQRMAAEAASKNILSALFGADGFGSGGGIIGGLISSFSGPSLSSGSMDLAKGGALFSFDVGTNYVPRDMVANIHKGEMIIPAYDAEKMRNGGMGGNNVTVNVINNSQSNVRTEERDNGNGMELTVMIDEAVARNIGTPGTRTNQALGAFNNRGLIRR